MTIWRRDLELAITLHKSVYECNFYIYSEYLVQSDFLYGRVNLLVKRKSSATGGKRGVHTCAHTLQYFALSSGLPSYFTV